MCYALCTLCSTNPLKKKSKSSEQNNKLYNLLFTINVLLDLLGIFFEGREEVGKQCILFCFRNV